MGTLLNPQNDIKLSFGMIVLNGEPFINYNLGNLYPHAHEILIVEGAVEKFAHAATSDGHSLDNTVDIIKSFPDPENKIKLIQRDGFWPEKDEMSNAYMEVCTGDYIWQVDIDEFYKPKDIEKVRDILAADPDISRVDVRSVCFLRSFNARVMGATLIYGADEFIRIFIFKPGYRYVTHRPPTLADETGQPFQHTKILRASDLEKLGIVQYHYSYVIHDYVKSKSDYYSRMSWGGGHEDGLHWFNQQWCSLSNPLRAHIQNFPPSWLVPFKGEHPEVITRMIKDIGFEEDPEIAKFLIKEYKKYQKAGAALADVLLKIRDRKISKTKAVLTCLSQLLLPTSVRTVNANRSIANTVFRILADKV